MRLGMFAGLDMFNAAVVSKFGSMILVLAHYISHPWILVLFALRVYSTQMLLGIHIQNRTSGFA